MIAKTGSWNKLLSGFKDALIASSDSKERIIAAISVSVLTFILLALGGNPEYSIQMFSAGTQYWATAVKDLTVLMYTTGLKGFIINILYSLLTGVAVVNAAVQLKTNQTAGKGILGLAPGLVASGCAGCGAGLLGFIGLTGALAAMPFEGDLLRFGGIGLIIFFLGKTGDPEKCRI